MIVAGALSVFVDQNDIWVDEEKSGFRNLILCKSSHIMLKETLDGNAHQSSVHTQTSHVVLLPAVDARHLI